MFEQIHSNPDIYKVPVVLPNNPLKNLNCYIIKTPSENLVIDTGFNQPECLEALTGGLKALDIDMDRTTLFLTHLHSDHIGLVNHIATGQTKILMSRTDYDYLSRDVDGDNWQSIRRVSMRLNIYSKQKVFPTETVLLSAPILSDVYRRPDIPRDTPVFLWKKKKYSLPEIIFYSISPRTSPCGAVLKTPLEIIWKV